MTLTDTGSLVALLDKNDADHALCMSTAKRLRPGPLLATWPCFTEAMYLLSKGNGTQAARRLWALHASGRLGLHDLTEAEIARMVALMEIYEDCPMDLADASLVAVAERLKLRQVFTLDAHFSDFPVGRWDDAGRCSIVPNAMRHGTDRSR